MNKVSQIVQPYVRGEQNKDLYKMRRYVILTYTRVLMNKPRHISTRNLQRTANQLATPF